ncbi:efflux pump, RND family, membrane fusion protein [Geotalea daltonii FRC-32]|uniref:Efflux pump, RND family, membrane fusion protein n=1 Tax=Geotalea daltonii (strain DSM 22248 / JCM 15807 / FRC-32) TaxID=316067 RepID=B9M672_GEODF|nr:efflux RND transporter periplasmic adaptor subunit [Geotalea daltonii]ACM21860.1 efflux pump, RND family, membrane fusion protein [Geotalea daltonii FRC-32]
MKDTKTTQTNQEEPLKHLLAHRSAGRFSRGWLWLAGALIVVAAVAIFFLRPGDKSTAPRYQTEPVDVGTLVVKVSATGNLQPTNQVDVGSELSGIIDRVFVDDNGQVKRGQVLARLDPAKLQDAVAKSRASLAAAEAQVLQAQATTAEARAALARFRQVAQLSGGKVPSKAEMDSAEANLKRAEANEASARASVTQTRANLQSDETNLSKASIRSPINGVVLARKVEPGQTVAASFQAPVLFTLAEDLSKMELQVDVDEADVGQVKVGQKATFSVDAWPGRKYDAVITRVGYGSQKKEGVVSYLTVLQVANDDLSLRPGMTGIAEITTLVHDNALLVPNAALRFTPSTTGTRQKKSGSSVMGVLMPRPPRQAPKVLATSTGTPKVWVLLNGQPAAIDVKTGATNGRVTEILSGPLKSGMQVITEALGSSS